MKSKKLNFIIYEYIKAYGKLPEHKSSEKSKYAYYCRKLQEEGKIEKIGYGVWKVKEVQKLQKGSSENLTKDRGHGYRFQLLLPKIKNWDQRAEYLKKKKIAYKPINGGQMMKCRRHNIYLFDDKIMLTFARGKSYINADPEVNDQKAIIEFKNTISALSNKLKTDFKVQNNYMFSCHHANINNMISKWHYDRGIKKFSIKDEFGEEWLLMDNSFNLLELETVHKETATKDMKNIVLPLMNTLKKNPNILGVLEENVGNLSQMLLKLTENSLQYSKNTTDMQNHIKSTQEQLRALTMLQMKNAETMETIIKYINSQSNR